jgi:Family of unknown function (DUF6527)
VKLADLNPQFLDEHGGAKGAGIAFDCPCGNHDEEHRCYVPFAIALDGSPVGHGERGWKRTGDTFETLTLTPSIQRLDCRWHGFITNGEVRTA